MNTVAPAADTGHRRQLGDEAIKAVERAAAEERGVADERGKLLLDLTAVRDQMVAEHQEIDRQLEWWRNRYPELPAAVELSKAYEWATDQLAHAEARLAAVAREQQAHEVAAVQLAEHAVALRAALDATRPDEPGPDRTVPDGPGSAIPGQPGYVVGECGHRVAASEWRSGFQVCERCPNPAETEAAS